MSEAIVVLCNRGDERKVIEDLRQDWVQDVLVAIGVPEQIFEDKMDNNDARDLLISMEIEVWKKHDGTIDILRQSKLVAQWKKPKITMIKEDKEFYYEIKTNEWALPFQMSQRGG